MKGKMGDALSADLSNFIQLDSIKDRSGVSTAWERDSKLEIES